MDRAWQAPTHTHTSWHTYTDREGATGLGQGHSPLLLWPIDSGLVLHFGHNAGLCTKYTRIQLSSDTDLQAHSYARTQNTTPGQIKQCRCSEKGGGSAMSVRPRIICCPNHWVRLDRCVCLRFAYLSLFHFTSLLLHPRIPLLPSTFVFAFCRAVIFSEASANDKRAHQTQGRLVIINTRRQTYIIFTSPAYLPARLSVTGPKSHTVTVWVTGSPAASECWHILRENTSRPSVAHMWLHLVTKGALSKHHVHEFPALTLETRWE